LLAAPAIGFGSSDLRFFDLSAAMWCSVCQQDVPALGSSSGGGGLRCGKCGGQLAAAEINAISEPALARATKTDNAALERALRGPRLVEDDWTIEAELRGVQRLVRSLKSTAPVEGQMAALHAPHSSLAGAHRRVGSAHQTSGRSELEAGAPRSALDAPRSNSAAWLTLSVGLATFACGAVLLAWSLLASRDDLWPVGLPLTLIGQAGLILGIVLQFDSLWHTSRKTAQVLGKLDEELTSVRHAASLLSTSHTSSAQSFYLHLAEGASPSLLLADLKGQLDLLAQQMAKQAR
jgi:hypothetical protein